MKKEETLEEAAENYSERHQDVSGNLGKYLVKSVFMDGAKWQAERMYTEKEVLDIIHKYQRRVLNGEGYGNLFAKWFKQFKKKL